MKRSRPELETPVSFLCKMVQEKMTEYWGKLRILLVFLKATKMTKGTWEWMIIEGWKDGLTHHMRYIQTQEDTLEG